MTGLNITPSLDMDPLMRRAFSDYRDDPLHVKLTGGVSKTASTREWNDTNDVQENSGFRVGRQWTLEIASDSALQLDADRIPDSEIDDSPRWLWLSTEARFASIDLTPEQCWDLQPRGQTVTGGGTFDLQFPKLAARAKGTLQIGAVALAGHQASIQGMSAINYGSHGAENFLFYIQGAFGQYDRNLIAQTDPATHIFDQGIPTEECSHITSSTFGGFATGSDAQVSCAFIAGSVGQRPDGSWIQHRRAFAYGDRNCGTVQGPNRVQLLTLYQCLKGRGYYNHSEGMSVGYYADTYASRGVDLRFNEFLMCRYHGVQVILSPGGVCPDQYSHEAYAIDGSNTITSDLENVMLDTLGPTTVQRFIRGIAVDEKFSLANRGATGVVRTGTQRTGCNRLPFLNR